MKLLLDECVPRKFKNYFARHECLTVPEAGFAGKKNGDLLSLAEQAEFQVFITVDQGIEYEQNAARRRISVIVIRTKTSRLVDLSAHVQEVLDRLGSIRAGQLVRVGGVSQVVGLGLYGSEWALRARGQECPRHRYAFLLLCIIEAVAEGLGRAV